MTLRSTVRKLVQESCNSQIWLKNSLYPCNLLEKKNKGANDMNASLTDIYNRETRDIRRAKLGEKLFLARHRAGFSQFEAAEKIGCSRYKLYRVEKGIADFSLIEIEELAAHFGLSLDELLHLL